DDEVNERSDDQDDDDDDPDDDDQGDDDQDYNDDDQDTNNDGDDFVHPKLSIQEEEAKDEESFDLIVQTPENSDDKVNDDASLGLNVSGEEGQDAEDDDKELYKDVNINLEGQDVQMTDVHTTQEIKDSHVTLTPINPNGQQQSSSVDVQVSTTVAPLTLSVPPPTIPTISKVPQALTPPTTTPSTFLQDLLNFSSLFGFDHHLKTLEANFSEFMQTNQFAGAVSSILGIVERYMDQRMNEAIKIIKDQFKEHVKVQVSKILPKIEKIMNEQLEAKVLTRSSNSSKTSYAMAADLLKMELKKILIEKMESNKSIQRSDEQRNLYKALVDAYESDKIILDTYGDTVTLKRRRDDADKDEEPSTGLDRGSKRRREGKELESTSTPKEKATKTTGKSTQGSKSHQKTASESALAKELMQANKDLEDPSHQEFKTGAADDQHICENSYFQNYLQQPMPNPEDIIDSTTVMNMALTVMAKAFKLNYSTPTNNNQRISSNPHNRQIAQPGNGNQNQIGNGNLVAVRVEENAAGHNGKQIRCYNCRGEEAGIQLQAKEYDLMAAAADLDEIEEVNANCILMANLQQASSSGTQTDSAPVYNSDGSAEVYENCDNNEICNMFTQEEQYTELLEPVPKPQQVPQNDNNFISEVTDVEQGRETVEQHSVYFEETRALYESLYQNLAIEVEKISDLNKQLSKENSTVSFLLGEKKKLKSDFKTCEDELLDKQIQLEKKIKEL
nr:hypothetical protein [Tanacetum cinerariifolium]